MDAAKLKRNIDSEKIPNPVIEAKTEAPIEGIGPEDIVTIGGKRFVSANAIKTAIIGFNTGATYGNTKEIQALKKQFKEFEKKMFVPEKNSDVDDNSTLPSSLYTKRAEPSSRKTGGSDKAENIAKGCIDLTRNLEKDSAKCATFNRGFNTIINSPDTTDIEKEVAELGKTVGRGSMGHNKWNAYTAMRAVMYREYIRTKFSTTAENLAAAAYSAYKDMWDDSISLNKVLMDGFNAIIKSPNTTEAEKKMARSGKIDFNYLKKPNDKLQAIKRVMKNIIGPEYKNIK